MGARCLTDPKLIMMVRRYHLWAISVPVVVAYPARMIRWESGAVRGIVTNPSDPKHVLKLLGYSDGLGVVITTHKHLSNAF